MIGTSETSPTTRSGGCLCPNTHFMVRELAYMPRHFLYAVPHIATHKQWTRRRGPLPGTTSYSRPGSCGLIGSSQAWHGRPVPKRTVLGSGIDRVGLHSTACCGCIFASR